MRLSTMWLVFINAVITVISSNSLAGNDCLTDGEIKSISAPYDVYFDEHETSSVIKYKVEFENNKNATEIDEYSSTVDTIEVYSKKNNCRDNFKLKQLKHCCESKLVVKHSYGQAGWAYFDNSFDVGCQNKTLSLTIQNPRDLYITLRLMSNDSIIHCHTTHLNHLPLIYHNSEQCMDPNNQCEEPALSGIESIEMIEGPGLYKKDRPNFYTLNVNTDRNDYDTYNYKVAYKIKTSKKLAFRGWILTAWNPDFKVWDRMNKFYLFSWMNGKGVLFRYFKRRFSDRYRFFVSMDSEKIIIYNYSKHFKNLGLRFEIRHSDLPLIFVDVTKDNRSQITTKVTAQNLLADTDQTPLQLSETVTEMVKNGDLPVKNEQLLPTAKLFNTTERNDALNKTGNITCHSGDCKIDHVSFVLWGVGITLGSFGLLGVGLILVSLGHYQL